MCCPRYDISQGEFVRPADIDVAEGCIVSVIPDIRFEGNIVIATAKPEPFDEFCAGFLRSRAPKKPRTGGTGCKKASTATVRDRVRAEFPWLTDVDIKAFENEQEDDAEGSGAIAGAVRRVDWEAVEDEAFIDVMDRLADRREEWAFEDDQLHFYVILPGGMWTEVHTGAVSDSAKCNARSHVKQWCKEFGWPQSKQFMFSAHGLDGANELAREWCRKGNFFFRSGETVQVQRTSIFLLVVQLNTKRIWGSSVGQPMFLLRMNEHGRPSWHSGELGPGRHRFQQLSTMQVFQFVGQTGRASSLFCARHRS